MMRGYLLRLARRYLERRGHVALPPSFVGFAVGGWAFAMIEKDPRGYARVIVEYPQGFGVEAIALNNSFIAEAAMLE